MSVGPGDLLAALRGSAALAPTEAFVWLWTYFDRACRGLSRAESRLNATGVLPWKLDLPSEHVTRRPGEISARIEALAALAQDEAAFDVEALRWLKGLDEALRSISAEWYRRRTDFHGFPEGARFALRPRNNFLADHFGRTSPREASQSIARTAYARNHLAVRQEEGAPRVRSIGAWQWADDALHLRIASERDALTVVMWRFACAPVPTCMANLAALPAGDHHVLLEGVVDEPALIAEVERAVAFAKDHRATILLLPELGVPPTVETRLRAALAAHGRQGHPILTLFGRCHRREGATAAAVNEAVLLGPEGAELHVHRKLACFRGLRVRDGVTVGENLVLGTDVSVLEADIGNVVPLICLDLLNFCTQETYLGSHGNVLLVPSLSPETGAHRDAAKTALLRNLASTFVANWTLVPVEPPERATSFFSVPRRRPLADEVTHLPDGAELEPGGLVFQLEPPTTR